MRKKRKDIVNKIKRIFDEYNVKREYVEDEFFLKIITAVEEENISIAAVNEKPEEHRTSRRDPKMEIMVNIEGVLNSLKGRTKKDKFTFGIDSGKNLSVFLTQVKLFIRDNKYNKHDAIFFYDDTALRTGNKGFMVTRDEIVYNIGGSFRTLRFLEMDSHPQIVQGPNKDAFRIFINDYSYDIKFKKNAPHHKIALEVMKLLYDYAELSKKKES